MLLVEKVENMHEQMNVSKETDERRIKNILTTKKKTWNRDEEYLLWVNTWVQQTQG